MALARIYVVILAGFSAWSSYRASMKGWPLIGSNLVNLSLASRILVSKLRYAATPAAEASAVS